jgi:hypothetical protein
MGWDAEDAEDAYWAARADEIEPEIPEDWDGTPPESDFEDPPEDAPDWNVRTDTALTGTTARHQPFRADEISVNQIAPPPERREGYRMWHDESQTIGQEKTRTMRKNAILAQIERAEATLRDLRAELSKIDRPYRLAGQAGDHLQLPLQRQGQDLHLRRRPHGRELAPHRARPRPPGRYDVGRTDGVGRVHRRNRRRY